MEHAGQQGGVTVDPDPFPLLPRGQVVFDDLPVAAVVMEALAPALGHGQVIVRDRHRGAVLLVRDGSVIDVHAFSEGGAPSGGVAVADVQSWSEALASAQRLDPVLVGVCESLLRGEVIYADLRLEWVDWTALLADFGRRGGAYAIEIFTPVGRGVTCLASGGQALSYTDVHPVLGDPALLGAMAANKEGTIQVRTLDATAFTPSTALPGSAPSASSSGMAVAAEPEEASPTSPGGEVDAEEDGGDAATATPTSPSGEDGADAVPDGEPRRDPDVSDDDLPSSGGGDGAPEAGGQEEGAQEEGTQDGDLANTGREGREVHHDTGWTPPWRPQSASDPGPAAGHGSHTPAALSVREVLADLHAIVKRRLQLSASPVQAVLHDGARQGRALDVLLGEIRQMSISGVQPTTVDAMVNEMSSAVAARHPG